MRTGLLGLRKICVLSSLVQRRLGVGVGAVAADVSKFRGAEICVEELVDVLGWAV